MALSSEQIDICKKGNLENIISLINQECNKNNILICMCQFGHLEIVKYLIEKCRVDVRSENDWAVQEASRHGHIQVVKYLVEKCGVDARAKYDYAVRIASMGGYLEVVKYLVEKCEADARADNDFAVRWASKKGHLEVVKYLVKKCGANARTYNDEAVLLASIYGHFEVVKYLVEKCRAVLPDVNPKYERYVSVCQKGEKKRTYIMAKRIYFWWVRMCYNPDTLCGQRSMYKGYREYLSTR